MSRLDLKKSILLILILVLLIVSTSTYIVEVEASEGDGSEVVVEEDEPLDELDLYKSIQEIDKESEELEEELVMLMGSIEKTKKDIAKKEKEIEKTEAEYNKQMDDFGKRLRIYYKEYGMTPSLYIAKQVDLLTKSKSIVEFMSRADMLKKIAEHDKEVMAQIQKIKDKLDKDKSELLSYRSYLARSEVEIKEKQKELEDIRESKIKELESMLSELDLKAEGEVNTKMYSLLDLSKSYVGGNMRNPFADESVYRISSPYGGRIHPITGVHKMHTGVDFAAPMGTPVYAINSGVVVWSGSYGGYGRTIMIDHGEGIMSLYAHNSVLHVDVGDEVEKGDLVCQVGSTGFSTGPHLHLEVRIEGKPVNPFEWVGSDLGKKLELKNKDLSTSTHKDKDESTDESTDKESTDKESTEK